MVLVNDLSDQCSYLHAWWSSPYGFHLFLNSYCLIKMCTTFVMFYIPVSQCNVVNTSLVCLWNLIINATLLLEISSTNNPCILIPCNLLISICYTTHAKYVKHDYCSCLYSTSWLLYYSIIESTFASNHLFC